jgi:hypothetical protein
MDEGVVEGFAGVLGKLVDFDEFITKYKLCFWEVKNEQGLAKA